MVEDVCVLLVVDVGRVRGERLSDGKGMASTLLRESKREKPYMASPSECNALCFSWLRFLRGQSYPMSKFVTRKTGA